MDKLINRGKGRNLYPEILGSIRPPWTGFPFSRAYSGRSCRLARRLERATKGEYPGQLARALIKRLLLAHTGALASQCLIITTVEEDRSRPKSRKERKKERKKRPLERYARLDINDKPQDFFMIIANDAHDAVCNWLAKQTSFLQIIQCTITTRFVS